jgi:hypothetical protein
LVPGLELRALRFARQEFYHLSYYASPWFCFFETVSCFVAQADLELVTFQLCPLNAELLAGILMENSNSHISKYYFVGLAEWLKW